MSWNDPDRWISLSIIGAMLGIFWRGVAMKKQQIDTELEDYVKTDQCESRQEIITLRIEKTIQVELVKLKDEIFDHLRAIEKAIQEK